MKLLSRQNSVTPFQSDVGFYRHVNSITSINVCNLTAMVLLVIVSAVSLLALAFSSSSSATNTLIKNNDLTRKVLQDSLFEIRNLLETSCQAVQFLLKSNLNYTQNVLTLSADQARTQGLNTAINTTTGLATRVMTKDLININLQIVSFLEAVTRQNMETASFIRDYRINLTIPSHAFMVIKQMISSWLPGAGGGTAVVTVNAHPLRARNISNGYLFQVGMPGPLGPVHFAILEKGLSYRTIGLSDFNTLRGEILWDKMCPAPDSLYPCRYEKCMLSNMNPNRTADIYQIDPILGKWKTVVGLPKGEKGFKWGTLWTWHSWLAIDAVFPVLDEKDQLLAMVGRTIIVERFDSLLQDIVDIKNGQRAMLLLPDSGLLLGVSHGRSKYLDATSSDSLPDAYAINATSSEDYVIRQAAQYIVRTFGSFQSVPRSKLITIHIAPPPPNYKPDVPITARPQLLDFVEITADTYSKYGCVDDPLGHMLSRGLTCNQARDLIQRGNLRPWVDPCRSYLDSPKFLFKHYCPVTCKVCNEKYWEDKGDVYNNSQCLDDFDGRFARTGLTCAQALSVLPCQAEARFLSDHFDPFPYATIKDVCPSMCGGCEKPLPCPDDPNKLLSSNKLTCKDVLPLGCSFDLNAQFPNIPNGTLVNIACPGSCNKCPVAGLKCADDPNKIVANKGFTCSGLLTLLKPYGGCDFDLSKVESSLPAGTLLKELCRGTCDNCEVQAKCSDDPNKVLVGTNVTCAALLVQNKGCNGTYNGYLIKRICPNSCAACDESPTCSDDPNQILETRKTSCPVILSQLIKNMGSLSISCQLDLHMTLTSVPLNTIVSSVCPNSCNACDQQKCIDDEKGIVKAKGLTCAKLLSQLNSGGGCTYDLHNLDETLPVSTTMSLLCPVTCNKCKTQTTRTPTPTAIPQDPIVAEDYYLQAMDIIDGRGTTWMAVTVLPVRAVMGPIMEMDQRLTINMKKSKLQVENEIDIAQKEVTSQMLISSADVQAKVDLSSKKADQTVEDGKNDSRRTVEKSQLITLLTTAIILIGACIVAILVNRAILTPLYAMVESMARVAKMELEAAQHLKPSKLKEINSMQRSFLRMVENLVEYRSYMPEAILVAQDPNTSAIEVTVSLVFTDIQNSTFLWETCPVGMRQAVKTHHTLLRSLIQLHNGYEVKTEGDAFMVAFTEASSAVQWCVESQIKLLSQEWPPDFLQLTDAARVEAPGGGTVLFNGPRVRMGIHTGTADCEIDPTTNRKDYYGHTVNLAARVSGLAKGGQILISRDTADSLTFNHPEYTLVSTGWHKLKGIMNEVEVLGVIPIKLQQREVPLPEGSGLPKLNQSMKIAISRSFQTPAAQTPSSPRTQTYTSIEMEKPMQGKFVTGVIMMLRLGQTAPIDMIVSNEQIVVATNLMVSAVNRHCSHTKGVLDSFGAGWATVSWNLATRCAKSAESACEAAQLLAKELHSEISSEVDITMELFCSLWMGESAVASMGSAGRKSFVLMGSGMEEARVLLYLAEYLRMPIVCNERLVRAMSGNKYHYHMIDIVAFPTHQETVYVQSPASSIWAVSSVGKENIYNAAMQAIQQGNYSKAETLLGQLPMHDRVVQRWLCLLQSNHASLPPGGYFRRVYMAPLETFPSELGTVNGEAYESQTSSVVSDSMVLPTPQAVNRPQHNNNNNTTAAAAANSKSSPRFLPVL